MKQKPIPYLLVWLVLFSCQTQGTKPHKEAAKIDRTTSDALSSNSSQSKIVSTQQKAEVTTSVPKGFRIASEYVADLNRDALEDKLLLLEVDDALDSTTLSRIFPDTFDREATPLLILIQQANGTWQEAARNNEVIYDMSFKESTGNGLSEIRLEKGAFTVEYFYHMSSHHRTESYTFEYAPQPKNWFLKAYYQAVTSDTPADSSGYDNPQEVTKTPNDFGQITFTDFKISDVE